MIAGGTQELISEQDEEEIEFLKRRILIDQYFETEEDEEKRMV